MRNSLPNNLNDIIIENDFDVFAKGPSIGWIMHHSVKRKNMRKKANFLSTKNSLKEVK